MEQRFLKAVASTRKRIVLAVQSDDVSSKCGEGALAAYRQYAKPKTDGAWRFTSPG